jgi:hypothetical protein
VAFLMEISGYVFFFFAVHALCIAFIRF